MTFEPNVILLYMLYMHSSLTWMSDDQSEQFSLEYPGISIHAVSRDTSTFPHECVYLLHCPTEEEEEEEEEESDEGVGEEGRASGNNGGKMTEIRLVPPDSSQCKFVA